jgi:hypothetical protein
LQLPVPLFVIPQGSAFAVAFAAAAAAAAAAAIAIAIAIAIESMVIDAVRSALVVVCSCCHPERSEGPRNPPPTHTA